MRPDFRVRPDLADASSPDGRLWRLYGLGTGEARRPSWGAISWIKGLMVCLACGAPPRWRNTYMSYKGYSPWTSRIQDPRPHVPSSRFRWHMTSSRADARKMTCWPQAFDPRGPGRVALGRKAAAFRLPNKTRLTVALGRKARRAFDKADSTGQRNGSCEMN